MKKILLCLCMLISVSLFANFNDGRYEVTHKQNNTTFTAKIIVKQSKIIFVDFDEINDKGIKLSTLDNDFRKNKEIAKKYIIENQSIENIPLNVSKASKEKFEELIKFLFDKSSGNSIGSFEI